MKIVRFLQTVSVRTLVLALICLVTTSRAQPSGYAITRQGADWRVLSQTRLEHGTNRIHSYTELATGLNYQKNGQWVSASEHIDILPDGTARAVQGRHQAYFPGDLFTGQIEVVTPDGKHLKSRPVGLSYFDGTNTVLIAELKDSLGVVSGENQVIYPDAFTGLQADVRYTYTKAGFEQDIVLEEQPPAPETFGLNPQTARLQVLTEFFNPPEPQKTTVKANPKAKSGLSDTTLTFGKLKMMPGKAFAIGSSSGGNSAQNKNQSRLTSAATGNVPVSKSWVHVQGRTFLVEELPVNRLATQLEQLPVPASAATTTMSSPNAVLDKVSATRLLPPLRLAQTSSMQLAKADVKYQTGVVLDYDEEDTDQSSFTFENGTTYLITGPVNLGDGSEDGSSVVFQGGAVIKFTTNATTGIYFDYLDAAYSTDIDHPVVLTSKDDDTVGDIISGSTGMPVTLTNVTFLGGELEDGIGCLYFRYAGIGMVSGDPDSVSNCRFFKCNVGIYQYLGALQLYNVLFEDCGTAVAYGDDGWLWLSAQYVTADNGADFLYDEGVGYSPDNFLYFQDSLITRYGDPSLTGSWSADSTVDNSFSQDNTSCYKTAGNAHCYLVTGSSYRGIGTPNLGGIQAMTTYAPQDGGWPDTNGTDIGYHYSVNEDSDFDGLPDAWEWKYFHSYTHSGGDLDSGGVNTLAYDYANSLDPNVINFTMRLGNGYFNTTNATGSVVVLSGIPNYEAVVVNSTNFNTAVWSNYDGTIHLNLGSTDGVYQVWFGLKGFAANATPTWIGTEVYLDRVAPQVIITNPFTNTVAVPSLQLQGRSPESLQRVTFDVSNAVAVVTNQAGILTGHYLDTNLLAFTTNYFQCYDVPLTNGVNKITVHAQDLAGNVTTTNLNITLSYSNATAPVIQLAWPTNGMQVCGGSFTLRGLVNDPTAGIAAQIVSTNGATNLVTGEVERTGVLWVENLPLNSGTNWLTLWVTNAAGLSSVTNIAIVKSGMTLALTNIDGDLWLPTVNVGGLISDTSAAVSVNGVQGTNYGNGTWGATNVPVSAGGMASFDVSATPTNDADPSISYVVAKASELVIESAIWGNGDFLASGPDFAEGTRRHLQGNFIRGKGGLIKETFEELDTNQVAYQTSWSYKTLSADGAAIIFFYATNSDGLSYATNAGPDVGDYTIAREMGQLNWSGFEGTNPQGWDVNSQVNMALHVGGLEKSAAHSLFEWVASAAEEFVGRDPAGIPPEQTSETGLMLDTNGVTWAAYPNGAVITDAALQTGVPFDAFTNAAPEYKLHIYQGTNDVTDSNVTAVVGQQINLTCALDSGAPAITNFAWTVPGTTVKSYIQTDTLGIKENLTTADLRTNTVNYYWIDGGLNKVVSCAVGVAGFSLSAQTTFKTTRPGATLLGTIVGEIRADGNYGKPGTWLHFGDYYDITNVVGIRWSGEVATPSNGAGGIAFAQLINRDAHRIRQSGTREKLTTSGAFVADNGDEGDNLYDGTVTGISNSDLKTHTDDDSPGLQYTGADASMSANDHFQIYLMFKSDLPNSIWVTLRTLTWQWSGTATNDTGWYLMPGATNSVTQSVDSIALPTWTTNYESSVGNNWISE